MSDKISTVFDPSKPVKQIGDWDSRAIPEQFLKRFLPDSSEEVSSPAKIGLKAFVELVNKHPELSFCLRGNAYDNQNPLSGGEVCIYENNHAMFVLRPQSMQINPNYLRYCDDCQIRLRGLINDFHFNNGIEPVLDVNATAKNDGTFSYSCSFPRKISVKYSTALLKNLEKLYNQMQEIFEMFFDPQCNQDRFLELAQKNGSVPIGYAGKEKPSQLEKRRQQQLYSAVRSQKDGYFFYDMEFQQKHKSKAGQENDKAKGLSNKPDMQAIRFDENGNPAAWVFVEVKCTAAAYRGASGLSKHCESMKKYIAKENRECLARRKREAFLLLTQYQKLGFCDLKLKWKDFEQLDEDLLLVFTDDAIDCWDNDTAIQKNEENEQSTVLADGSNVRFFAMRKTSK